MSRWRGWVVCTITAGVKEVFSTDLAIGFLSHASRFSDATAAGKILPPAKNLGERGRIAFTDYVDATLAALFPAMVAYGVLA